MTVSELSPDAWDRAKDFGQWGFTRNRGGAIDKGDLLLVHFGGSGIGAVAEALGPVHEISAETDAARSWGQVRGGVLVQHLFRFPIRVVAEYPHRLVVK